MLCQVMFTRAIVWCAKLCCKSKALISDVPRAFAIILGQRGWEGVADYALDWALPHAWSEEAVRDAGAFL